MLQTNLHVVSLNAAFSHSRCSLVFCCHVVSSLDGVVLILGMLLMCQASALEGLRTTGSPWCTRILAILALHVTCTCLDMVRNSLTWFLDSRSFLAVDYWVLRAVVVKANVVNLNHYVGVTPGCADSNRNRCEPRQNNIIRILYSCIDRT
eukprot:740941-Amphidinium_carterae.1